MSELWAVALAPAVFAACRYGAEAGALLGAVAAVVDAIAHGPSPIRGVVLVGLPILSAWLVAAERRRAAKRARVALGELRGVQLGEYLSWTLFQLREYLISVTSVAVAVHTTAPNERTERLQRLVGELNTKAGRLLGDRTALTTGHDVAAPFDLAALARETARLAEAVFGGGPVKVVVEGEVPPVASDRRAVQACLLAALQNALERGGAAVVTARARGGRAELELIDSAGGFAADETVFEPFLAAKRGGGLGLGLPIARRMLQRLGGDVKVRGVQGGTAVLLEVPLTRDLPRVRNEESTWAGRRNQA